ncbi:60S ribosomal protein L6 [Dispira parvispora]|uniref:60S ribosomal protein L6 n=1 Tax=Dispira parvispora TaxID=1520584 RepID=A0A9W8AMN1_9FUNG|nr:60S ribosomal protein L6 [Dispira parvispora]
MAHAPRNSFLVPGIPRFSRSKTFAKRGLFKRKPQKVQKQAAPATTATPSGFYPAEDIRQKKVVRKTLRPSKLRGTITPGTVLILLAGRFRGKRVVFLKQLESGLLLVTGPFRINGVPIKRVNQAYVIATSTKVDISKIELDAQLNDGLFKHEKASKRELCEKNFFNDKAEPKKLPATFVALQRALDKAILEEVLKTPLLLAYLKNTFSLQQGQAPHLLKF